MKKITVFTPTYNRAYCLNQLYESLLRQTSNDFEWLVIDDGSTDRTKSLVQGWIDENKISIKYHYKKNGGMHTGHNEAFKLIETELNVCIDSDDYMPDDAVEKIIFLWNKYGNNNYAGIIGLDISINNNIIGNKFPKNLKESAYSELKTKYNVVGDKKIVYRTDIVKKLEPYPVFYNEKFVPLYFPILVDVDYKFLCFNEIFCIVDYQLDGSTLNIYNQYFKNPNGFLHLRKIQMVNLKSRKSKFRSAIHFISTCIILKSFKPILKSPKKCYTILAIPFGITLYFFLVFNRNKNRDITKYI